MQGRVFRISAPMVGSSWTPQTSPLEIIIVNATQVGIRKFRQLRILGIIGREGLRSLLQSICRLV